MAVGAMFFSISFVHGQTPTTINGTASPNLRFAAQPAYISIGNPADPSSPVTQSENNSQGTNDVIISVVITIIGVIAAKFHSDGKTSKLQNVVKGNMGEMLKDKNIRDELAKLLYQFNPEKANALNDAPDVKLENLKNNTKEFADKAAKT